LKFVHLKDYNSTTFIMGRTVSRLVGKFLRLFLSSQTVSLFFLVLSVVLIWRNFQELPLAVPLWFSKPWGEQRLAEPVFLWLLPVSSLVIFVLNFVLSKFFEHKEKFLYLFLLWSNLVVSWLFFYTLFEIIRVVS